MDYDIDMGPDPDLLMIAGDWHGNTRWAQAAIEAAYVKGADAILQVGDFGYWPGEQSLGDGYLTKLNEQLEHYDLNLFWLDGNHENHELLNPGFKSGRIQHLPRGFRWQWWGKTWMSVGGGVSVDKEWRTEGVSWFPEETLTPEQFEYSTREGKVDIIVSHDTVDNYRIPGVHAAGKQGDDPTRDECDECGLTSGAHKMSCNQQSFFPADAIADSEAHRNLLGQIVDATRPDYLFHGHYHSRYNKVVDRPYGPLTIVGMAEDASQMGLNTLVLSSVDLETGVSDSQEDVTA